MSLLLDTNICIAYLNGKDSGVRDRLLAHSPEELLLCSVVKAELLYGARNSTHVDENLVRLEPLVLSTSLVAREHLAGHDVAP